MQKLLARALSMVVFAGVAYFAHANGYERLAGFAMFWLLAAAIVHFLTT